MDDLISRQAALDEIDGFIALDKYYHPYSQGKTIPVEEMRERLRSLPSATPTCNKLATDLQSDTISRQAAIDALIKADYEFTGILSEPRARRFEQTINALPSAQPEIIRCKDCKHLKRSETNRRLMMCQRRGRLLNLVSELDFCSKAERRTDERPDQN